MLDRERVFEFVDRLNKEDLSTCLLSVSGKETPYVQQAEQIKKLMNDNRFSKERVWEILELKERYKIEKWEDACELYLNGGEIQIPQGSGDQASCFDKYLVKLENNGWDKDNLDNMRRQTVDLIGQMNEFSQRPGNEEKLCTALVVGHVQSGKTANYCADINFWYDLCREGKTPGYDTFIILTSNNTALGNQTEDRLRRDIIPVSEWCEEQSNEDLKLYGGLLPLRDDCALFTRPENRGTYRHADKLAYTPSDKNPKCLVAVAIKNSAIITNLNTFLSTRRSDRPNGIIIVDDEADVITPTLKGNGDAAKTRKAILSLIDTWHKKNPIPVAYVAFTATPYATVLNQRPSEDRNPLYPHIAQVLTPSKEYFGSNRILGAMGEEKSGQVVVIDDDFGNELPDSLKNAFAWFLCTAAARRYTNNSGKYQPTSMLIHLSKKVDEHEKALEMLKEYLKAQRTDIMERCRCHWCDDNGLRERYRQKDLPQDYPGRNNANEFDLMTWDALKQVIEKLVDEDPTEDVNAFGRGVNFRKVNAKARSGKFDFHYPSDEEVNFDTAFVAIGGDRIARGLTLEGLTTTYFGRKTKYGDTLLQYARWHGYRRGYEVLPRVWMPEDSIKEFKNAAKMEEETRLRWIAEFEREVDHWQHPLTVAYPIGASFVPTGKMKDAVGATGQSRFQFDTNTFPADKEVWRKVRKDTEAFLQELGNSEELRNNKLWREVSSGTVVGYLQKVAARYPDSSTFCSWLDGDKNRLLEGDVKWNVCFIPLQRGDGKPVFQENGSFFDNQALRTVARKHSSDVNFYVKTIRSAMVDDVADVPGVVGNPGKNDEIDNILGKAGLSHTPLLRIYLHAPEDNDGATWLEGMTPEECKSNPVVLLSIRRKFDDNTMVSLQVNRADDEDFSEGDQEERNNRIRNTIFELQLSSGDDNEDGDRSVCCRFTPSTNKQRNTPKECTLIKGSWILPESAKELEIEDKVVGGLLTDNVPITECFAYNLAKILLKDSRKYGKKDCDLWLDRDNENVSLLDLLSGGKNQ